MLELGLPGPFPMLFLVSCSSSRGTGARGGCGLELQGLAQMCIHLEAAPSSVSRTVLPVIATPGPPALALSGHVTSGSAEPHRALECNDGLYLADSLRRCKCPAPRNPVNICCLAFHFFLGKPGSPSITQRRRCLQGTVSAFD